MGKTWTTEQAISLAPDAAALKAAQGLAAPRKWTLRGRDDNFAWGLAQGSGAQPYQVQIDLSEPAFKCSCPSRKFPCKHGLGLLLMMAADANALAEGPRPDWVTEWAAKRAEKAAKAEAKETAVAEAAPDPAAQAKRREKREANVSQGLEFLDGWLNDIARQGLAAVASSGYAFWDAPARRMVDAQAPGLVRRIRALGNFASTSVHDEERAIAELGRLHLLVAASLRRAALPAEWQEEIDSQLGRTIDQDELRRRDGVPGVWFVGAQSVREEEKIITRVSYLFGERGQSAQLFEFSPAARPTVSTIALGRWLAGELVFYPGVHSKRALWKTTPNDEAAGKLDFHTRCEDVLALHASTVAANPFIEAMPVLAELTPCRHHERWWVRDESGAALPISRAFSRGWELFACAGGQAVRMVGLWDGFAFAPLTVLDGDNLISFSQRAQ